MTAKSRETAERATAPILCDRRTFSKATANNILNVVAAFAASILVNSIV